jgi:myo-inositol-1-phosphate synthase
MPGMGAVATAFIAGVELVKKGLAGPVGSLVKFESVRLGKRTESRVPKIKDLVLPGRDGGTCIRWLGRFFQRRLRGRCPRRGPREGTPERRARAAQGNKAVPAVFDSRYVLRIEAAHRKDCASLGEATEQVREDMRTFKSEHGLDRAVMIHCASTAAYAQPQKAHFDLDEFEAALERSDSSISPAMVYSYAALQEGVPCIRPSRWYRQEAVSEREMEDVRRKFPSEFDPLFE